MSCILFFYFRGLHICPAVFCYFASISMPAIQINTPFNLALDFEVAALHKRILAYVVDLVVLVIYSWGMKAFLDDILSDRYDSWYGIDILLVSIPMLLYCFYLRNNVAWSIAW